MQRIDYEKALAQMPPQMDSAERMSAYMAGEEVDFLPYNLMDVELPLADILGYTTLEWSNDFEIFAELIRQKELKLGIKGASIGLDLRAVGTALGTELSYPERGIPCIKKHILQDYKDLDRLPPFSPKKNPFLQKKLETARRLKERFPDLPISTSTNGPLSAAQSIRPAELILTDMRRNKAELHRLLHFTLDCCLEWVRCFTEAFGPVSFSFGDPLASGNLISKKLYDEFALPYQKKLIEGVIAITGIKPVCHICGKSRHLWEDIADMPLTGFSVDNIEDIAQLKEVLGDKMLIIGNVSPTEVLRFGQPEDVVEAVKSCIAKAADSPKGYLLHTGCDVPLYTSLENMYAYIYAVRTYGRNARMGRLPEGMQMCTE